jgi:hypothetical protein
MKIDKYYFIKHAGQFLRGRYVKMAQYGNIELYKQLHNKVISCYVYKKDAQELIEYSTMLPSEMHMLIVGVNEELRKYGHSYQSGLTKKV